MTKLQSDQEELVHYFASRSIGSEFIFLPDKIDGKEPFDLAWRWRDITVLFAITKIGSEREVSSADEMCQHNFGQLHGFFRKRWSAGQILSGSNRVQGFKIPYTDAGRVILISIVGGRWATAQINNEQTKRFQDKGFPVVLCATLPDHLLRLMAAHMFGFRELVEIIRWLELEKEVKSIEQIDDYVWKLTRKIFPHFLSTNECHVKRYFSDLNYVFEHIGLHKKLGLLDIDDPSVAIHVSGCLNLLRWTDLMKLALTITDFIFHRYRKRTKTVPYAIGIVYRVEPGPIGLYLRRLELPHSGSIDNSFERFLKRSAEEDCQLIICFGEHTDGHLKWSITVPDSRSNVIERFDPLR